MQLGTLPLTPNGKVDRNSLPAPKAADYEAGRDYVAPRDTTERRLAELWEEVLGIRPIGVTTSFFDLGGRSILAARLFTRISRTFGKDLPLATLFQAPTIEQLAKELRPQSQSRYSTLVPIRTQGDRPPFFCVHGGEGSTLFLHRLAREMPEDQPFYGIEPEGLDGRRFHRTTIPQMAAHYLAEIRKVQPHGPYSIGGYCFGGLVAFEMAQQLVAQGEQASLVALFSAPLRFHRRVPDPNAVHQNSTATPLRRSRLGRLFFSPGQALRWRFRLLNRMVRQSLHWATCKLFLTCRSTDSCDPAHHVRGTHDQSSRAELHPATLRRNHYSVSRQRVCTKTTSTWDGTDSRTICKFSNSATAVCARAATS